jgi:hypothetical protein
MPLIAFWSFRFPLTFVVWSLPHRRCQSSIPSTVSLAPSISSGVTSLGHECLAAWSWLELSTRSAFTQYSFPEQGILQQLQHAQSKHDVMTWWDSPNINAVSLF